MEDAGLLDLAPEIAELLTIEARYQGYLSKQESEVSRFKKSERVRIPVDMPWENIPGLSSELRQKLSHIRPATLGQANRIPGMTPAAISLLLVYLDRH